MPLKVLSYLHSFEAGGVERDILRFNKAWKDAGLDVHIALGRADGPLANEMPDVPFTLFQTGRLSSARFESLWMIAHLPPLIRRLRPDVIFCAGNGSTIVAVVLRLLLGRRCPPMVFRVSNDLVRRDLWAPVRWVYHRWLRIHPRFFAAIVAMALPARAEILEYLRADPANVTVIDNGSLTCADADRLAQARDAAVRDRAGRHYLGVGRLAPQKNFAFLIEAFAAIAMPEDTLTIVGEGQCRASIERRAQALGVLAQVHLPGHRSALTSYFAQADALVLSSDFEGLGIVVIEALAAGLPVVATDCGPNMAMLVEGAGRLVPMREAKALAAAMAAIVNDPVDTDAMRARALRFTVEASTPAWCALFADVAR